MVVDTKIQMRFADVDMLGHVNNVNQQHYFDVGKSDFFHQVLHLEPYWREEGLITVAINTSFIRQIRMTEPIIVRTRVREIGHKSFTLTQQIINTETQELKTDSVVTLVCFDFAAQQSIPIPERWRKALEEALQ